MICNEIRRGTVNLNVDASCNLKLSTPDYKLAFHLFTDCPVLLSRLHSSPPPPPHTRRVHRLLTSRSRHGGAGGAWTAAPRRAGLAGEICSRSFKYLSWWLEIARGGSLALSHRPRTETQSSRWVQITTVISHTHTERRNTHSRHRDC